MDDEKPRYSELIDGAVSISLETLGDGTDTPTVVARNEQLNTAVTLAVGRHDIKRLLCAIEHVSEIIYHDEMEKRR